jgi:predicted flavoprotein YhiN
MMSENLLSVPIAIVGGGPAGLMAAQVLSDAGLSVHLFDAMPSIGRKFLLAGKGGLNLTHSENADTFAGRYGARRAAIESLLAGFDPAAVRNWALGLGIETFVGSSGRVFPKDMKAAPLLRAWLQRLRHPAQGMGVRFHMRHRWTGWEEGDPSMLCFRQSPGHLARAGGSCRAGAGRRKLGAFGLQRGLGTVVGCAGRSCGPVACVQLWF